MKFKSKPQEAQAEQAREAGKPIEWAKMLELPGGSDLMYVLCRYKEELRPRFLEAGNRSGGLDVTEHMLVEVCGAKHIPEYYRPMAVVAGLAVLAKEIDAIEERGESPEKRIKEIVGDFENDFRTSRGDAIAKIDKIVQGVRIGEPAEAREKRKLIEEITEYIAGKMDEPERTDFLTHYAWMKFQPALEKLSMSVLKKFRVRNESDELEFAKYYARLHVEFLKHGGGGGPANIIERVADNQNIPDEKKFKVIVVALYELFAEATGPRGEREGTQDVARDEVLAKEIVDRLAKSEALDKELERLDYCLKLRKAVANRITEKQNRETFLKDPSLNYFIRGMRKLDMDALKELANTGYGVGAAYVESHAKLMNRKIFGVPGRLLLYLGEQEMDKSLQAPVITGVVKQLADRTVRISDKPGQDQLDEYVAAGKKSIDGLVHEASKGDVEKFRNYLVDYALGRQA